MMSDKLVLMKPNHFEIYFFLFGQKKVKKKNLISSLATYAVHQVALKKWNLFDKFLKSKVK